MTELTITGVNVKRTRKTGLDEVFEDVAAGRVYHADSVEDLFNQLNS